MFGVEWNLSRNNMKCIYNNIYCLLTTAILVILSSCSGINNDYRIKSPDGRAQLSISVKYGVLKYQLNWQDELLLDASEVSILPNESIKILKATERTSDKTWAPSWGQFSEVRDHHNELVLDLDIGGAIGKLIARVYDRGVGFRFEIDSLRGEREAIFSMEHKLANNDQLYWPAGESEPKGPVAYQEVINSTEDKLRLALPLVVEKSSQIYLSILESDLYSAKGFGVMRFVTNKNGAPIKSINRSKINGQKLVSPWRLILFGETEGDLVTNTVPVNLATPCQIENPDWIKPGKTLWDWRVHGYTAPDGFKYGVSTESYKRFIDFAAQKGIEYFLIDDSWYEHASKGHFELSEELDLNAVIDYAAKKGVDLILYYDRKHGEYGDDELFPFVQSLGIKGIKYGFMGKKVDFSREAIQKSAESKLLIDFHDGPVPFTGIRRTYPNAITREYCHAQQDSRRAFTPEAFIKMALINAIQGPLDMNNGNFDIIGINSGIRQKGPRMKGSYLTTVVSEAARTLIIFSGLVCIPDAPEAYLAKEDLFEFIQKQPVGRWDETRILHASMGEYITTARRHGDEWFVGSVYNQQGGELEIKLDFLKPGTNYEVTFYEDTEETHCQTNPEAYQVRDGEVTKDEKIKAKIAPGGGHCMWIRPKN